MLAHWSYQIVRNLPLTKKNNPVKLRLNKQNVFYKMLENI